MTLQEFNTKWEEFIEFDHNGLQIDDQDVINFLDEKFQHFSQDPDFLCYSIFLKDGNPKYYGTDDVNPIELEQAIRAILEKNKDA